MSLINLASPRLRGKIIGGMTSAVFPGQFVSPLLTNPLRLTFGLATSFKLTALVLAITGFSFMVASLVHFFKDKKTISEP